MVLLGPAAMSRPGNATEGVAVQPNVTGVDGVPLRVDMSCKSALET